MGSGHPIENPRHRSVALVVVINTGVYVSLCHFNGKW